MMADWLDVTKSVAKGWERKCWDIPKCVTICVPIEGQRKNRDIPRNVTICVPMEER